MTTDPAEPDGSDAPTVQGRSLVIVGLTIVVIGWLARPIIGPFIVAAIVAYAFSPVVSAVQTRTGLRRVAVVGIGYVAACLVIGGLGFLVAGQLVQELELLGASGPDALATTIRQLVGSDTIALGSQQVPIVSVAHALQAGITGFVASPGDAVALASRVGEFALQAILALIVTFYFLVDGGMIRDWLIALLPSEHRARTVGVLARIHIVLGKWLRGQLLLMALVASVVYVALGPILHLPYALAIGVLTGILEIVPLIGPLIATVIAGTDAFAHGGASLAVTVVIFYFVLRQLEDQVVMPVVVGRAVHLHPVVTIFAVLVGLSTYGVLGGLLGVPVAAAVNVIFGELTGPPSPPSVAPHV